MSNLPLEDKIRKILRKFKNEIENPNPPPAHTQKEWIECELLSYAHEIALMIYNKIKNIKTIQKFINK